MPRRRDRRSTGPTACAPSPGCASSGRASTASRASTAPSSTATSTRSGSASASTTDCSDLNGPQQRMKEGAEALGWSFQTHRPQRRPGALRPGERRLHRLRRPVRLQAVARAKTYLADAVDARRRDRRAAARAERVLVEDGRAAGRRGAPTPTRRRARARAVTVRAPQVVVACGALESPALLLRSGIGGPAVGDYLRLHPCTAMFGIYGEDQQRLVGRAARRARRRVRRRRGRLRLPDRGRAVHDRRSAGSALPVHDRRRRTRS